MTWIRRFKEPCGRYHAIVATLPGGERMVTACGRSVEFLDVAHSFLATESFLPSPTPPRCFCCRRRTERTKYLLPSGPSIEALLNPVHCMGTLWSRAELESLLASFKRSHRRQGAATR